MTERAGLHVDVLGALRATVDGQPVEVAGRRLRALLARLAVAGDAVVPVPVLADAVWEGAPPAEETAALQSLVSRLRRALGGPGTVEQSAGGYRLAGATVDAVRAAALLEQSHRAPHVEAAELLAQARGLWRGDPAEELPEGELVRLRELRGAVVAAGIRADLRSGRPVEGVPELEAAAAQDPLDEPLAALLVEAHAAAGRQVEALAAYDRLRRALADELGLDPSPELQARHLELLRREPAPAVPRLRAAWTSFVGRDADLDRVAALLETERLVTVLGTGGAGKTRLALEIAGRQAGRQVALVELAPVTDPGEVPPAVLAALGRHETAALDVRAPRPPRETVELVVEQLTARDALLVLDNCEHLLDAVAGLVDQLLAACPSLRVLATSREPLALVGEALAPLPPLPLPPEGADAEAAARSPAVRLLLDRAAAARPGFTLDDANTPAVVEIVRRLDGLPLAIELAAARLRTLPVAEVAHRLSDRFRLLTGGSRTALPRHRTLHAVVAWSWDLLTPQERLLAERLALLVGGISPTAAAAVCDGDGLAAADIPDLLEALADRSLLEQVGDRPRYRMLETIREYGLERLAERGELAAVREAYAGHFGALAATADADLRTSRQLAALDLLRLEHDNVLAALRLRCDDGRLDDALSLALDLGWYWQLLGRDAEAHSWLSTALELPGGDPGLRAQAEVLLVLSAAAQLPSPSDRPGPVPVPDSPVRPVVALWLPVAQYFAGDADSSRAALTRLATDADPWLAASAHLFLARFAENDGDLPGVLADGEAALAAFRALGDTWGIATALPLIALVRQYDGDLTGALAALREAERCLRVLGRLDVRDELFLEIRLVDLHNRLGHHELALAGCRQAQALARRSGSVELLAITLAVTAGVVRVLGDLPAAVDLQRAADDSLAELTGTSPEHGVAVVEGGGALLDVALGQVEPARARLRRAYPAAVAAADLPILSIVGLGTAALAARSGRPLAAASALGASARLRGADDATNPDVRRVEADCRLQLGDDAFAAAYGLARTLGPVGAIAAVDPDLLDAPP